MGLCKEAITAAALASADSNRPPLGDEQQPKFAASFSAKLKKGGIRKRTKTKEDVEGGGLVGGNVHVPDPVAVSPVGEAAQAEPVPSVTEFSAVQEQEAQ